VADIDDFIADSNGLRLIGAFMRIDNAALRRRIMVDGHPTVRDGTSAAK
jgi:hypothetical protein